MGTTFKMSKHLLSFLIVYLFVLIPFATIFKFVMRDPKCPAYHLPGSTSIADSAYQTYKVMFGHGEFYFDSTVDVKFTYLIYSMITILLMLNMVIAIMSTTASIAMQTPWKETLYMMEHLNEALESEFLHMLLLFPIMQRLHLKNLEKMPYCVVHTEPELKVYFEVEHSNMEKQNN